jgi:ATPase family AAA domain-containing protein 3A/B
MQEQAKLDRETQIARAQAEAKGRTEQERENVEVRLREMRARLSEERKTRLESIQEIFGGLGAGSKALLEDRTKLTALVGGLTALALGVYSARAATRVGGNLIERQLMRPPLVRETSRFTWSANAGQWRWPWSKQDGKIMEKIVLEDELAERLEWTTNSLVNAKRNGTPFRHLILHGPPGTGKTLFARTLSRQSGLDYAIMSGGDVGPLGKDAVHEVNKLFTWANSSRKGLILFIDEADAFLRTGRGSESGGMSEEARNVLSAFLHHTGTESDKFVVVLATNIRGVLDRAVLDRIDESFEFPLPSAKERQRMLEMFMDQYIHTPTKKGRQIEVDEAIDEEWITKVAERTDGFSGRQLSKLVVAYQAAVFGSGTTRLTTGLAETVLQYKLAHREDSPVVIAGDLNGPSNDVVGYQLSKAGFVNAWNVANDGPCRASHKDHRGQEFASDHVWHSRGLNAEVAELLPKGVSDNEPLSRPTIGSAMRRDGPLVTLDDWCTLSDHRPLLVTFS